MWVELDDADVRLAIESHVRGKGHVVYPGCDDVEVSIDALGRVYARVRIHDPVDDLRTKGG